MTFKRTIQIDLAVSRKIETLRVTPDQDHNDILRSHFSLAPTHSYLHKYAIRLLSARVSASHKVKCYRRCLILLHVLDNEFLNAFSKHSASRDRKYVARDKNDIYLSSPNLKYRYARELVDGWYYDSNIDDNAIRRRLRDACDVLGLEFGTDLVVEF